MTGTQAREIGLIDVIPNAGATLNVGQDWRDGIAVPDSDPTIAELASTVSGDEMLSFLREEHHSSYGRPWVIGQMYDSYLRERGIGGKDRVLDFGCGAGRLGAQLIPRLKPTAYVGVDNHLLALKAFAAYEIPLGQLERFSPALVWGGVESLRFFQPDFTVALDLFTSLHMTPPIRDLYFRELRRLLEPEGRLITLATGSDVAQSAISAGFRITHKQVQSIDMLWPMVRKKRQNSWVEFGVRPH